MAEDKIDLGTRKTTGTVKGGSLGDKLLAQETEPPKETLGNRLLQQEADHRASLTPTVGPDGQATVYKPEVRSLDSNSNDYLSAALLSGSRLGEYDERPEVVAQQNLERDFSAMQQGKPEDVQDWQQIARMTVEMGMTDDPELHDIKDALLWSYGDQLKGHVDAIDNTWWDSHYVEEPEQTDDSRFGWKSKLAGAAEYIDQWGQSALGAVGGIEAALSRNDGVSFGEGIAHTNSQLARAFDPTRVLGDSRSLTQGLGEASQIQTKDGLLSFDRDQDGSLNLREALGKDPEAGGRLLGAIDLLGTIALDPTTYVTLGPSSLAKIGMKGAQEAAETFALRGIRIVLEDGTEKLVTRTLAEGLTQRITKHGMKSLEEVEQKLYADLVKEAANAGVEGTGRAVTRLGPLGEKLGMGASYLDDAQIAAIRRGGQGGVRFGGVTLPGTGRVTGGLNNLVGTGTRRFGEVDELLQAPVDKAADSIVTGTGRFGDDMGNLADGRLPEPKLPADGVPGQKALDLDTPEFNKITGEPYENVSQGVMTWRNMGRTYEQIDDNFNRAIEVYDQQVFIRPGVKKPTLKPAVAIKPMQTIMADTLKVMDDALEVGGKLGPLHGPYVNEIGDRVLTRVVRQGMEDTPRLIGRLLETPAMQGVLKHLSPRTVVRAVFGDTVADRLGHLLSVTREDPEVGEILVRLGADMNTNGLMKKSVKEFASQDEWERFLNEAMSSADGRTAALSKAGPETTKLLETMQSVRERLRAVAIRGGANPEHLGGIDEYLPRILSDMANKTDVVEQMKNVGDPGLAMSGDRVAEAFMQRRTIADNLNNLFDTNSEAYRILSNAGIDAPAKLFETNPVAAFAARTRSAFRAAGDVDLLDGITKIEGNNGIPLAFRSTADDAAKLTADEASIGAIRQAGGNLADFKKVTLDNGTVYRVQKDVAEELENVRRVFGDPKEMTAAGKFFDKMNNVWAMSATVAGVNPGFHVRNGIGNVFNAFLGGTRDPSVFIEAGRLQSQMRKVTAAMRDTGKSWDEVAEAGVKGVDKEALDILSGARKMGILGDGRSLDILKDTAGGANTQVGFGNRLNPTDANSVWMKPGVIVGEAVEGNARLGVYLDQLAKGASPEQAAQHVKKYLFDYSDLTRFEHEGIRRVSRFYTFLRKNTALQAYTLTHYPARIANAEAGVQGIIDGIFGGESAEDRQLPPWMPGASIMDIGGGRQAAIAVDTPFASFKEFTEILTGDPNPDPLKQLGAETGMVGFANRATSLFSGVGPSAVDFLTELETKRDSFTGRSLDPDNQVRDTWWFSAMASAFPAFSRWEGLAARNATINDWADLRKNKDGEITGPVPWQLQMLNLASGLQAYEVSDDTDGQARYTLMKEIEDIIKGMKEDGLEVRTIDQMREQGDLQMKNRVVETLMYGWKENEDGTLSFDDAETNAQLLQILPKNVRDAFVNMGVLTDADITRLDAADRVTDKGSRPDVLEGSVEARAQLQYDFDQALEAIELYLDRPVSDAEWWAMASTFGGALSVTEQENIGLNPYRDNPHLRPEQTQAQRDQDYANGVAIFEDRFASRGITWDDALARYPRISKAQRNFDWAREAGWSEEEIKTALYYAPDEGGEGWTSRNDRAAINQFMTGDRTGGAVPLTLLRNPVLTSEDHQKLQTKVWEAGEELKLIFQFEGWGVPTQEMLFMYGVNNLTKAEQRLVGIDPLDSAPSRDDIRSDEQKLADAQYNVSAVEAGQASPYRWDRTAGAN